MTISKQVSRIAVIGAGPSGLAAVKYLLAEKCFDKIDVFEKRSAAGGVWNYSSGALKKELPTPVPQLDPNGPLEDPVWSPTCPNDGASEVTFVSPIYDTLEANLPKELMRFSDKLFPDEEQVLPRHSVVKKYLHGYAEDVKELIQLETQVQDLRPNPSGASGWALTIRNLRTGDDKTDSYDAVVVASGHYDVTYLPDIPGIREWNKAYPKVISHSKHYDSPPIFRDKKAVVVGSSASAIDIGAQISEVSKGKLLVSERSESYLQPPPTTDKIYFPEIVEFLPSANYDRAIRFADGRIESEIDAIVFCTGYLYSFPFLSSLDPPVITDGRRTVNAYQHLFYTYNPTLVFPLMTQRIVPFPFAESQASVFARVWSGRLSLPSQAEMIAWEKNLVAEKGNGTFFHYLPYPQDADNINLLYNWAASAEKRSGLANDGAGKLPPLWGEKERWLRCHFPDIRKAFIEQGEARRNIRSVAELGYDYEQRKVQEQV